MEPYSRILFVQNTWSRTPRVWLSPPWSLGSFVQASQTPRGILQVVVNVGNVVWSQSQDKNFCHELRGSGWKSAPVSPFWETFTLRLWDQHSVKHSTFRLMMGLLQDSLGFWSFTRVRRYAAPDYSHSSPPPPFAGSPETEPKDQWVGGWVGMCVISILVIWAVCKPQSFEEHGARYFSWGNLTLAHPQQPAASHGHGWQSWLQVVFQSLSLHTLLPCHRHSDRSEFRLFHFAEAWKAM